MERPQFSERVFEFCFNAEFVRKNASAIIGIPYIPSQKLEGVYGYDVLFRLKQGDRQYSLFLQHKVSSFTDKKAGRNWHVYNFHGGPYYSYYLERLDKSHQHNLLYNLRQAGYAVYYTSPLFFRYDDLTQHFLNNVVIDKSCFIDPYDIGLITDFESHRTTYDMNGTQAAFHSEIKNIENICNFEVITQKLKQRKIDEGYFSELLSVLKAQLGKIYPEELSLPEGYRDYPNVLKCTYLLRRYYKLQWIIF